MCPLQPAKLRISPVNDARTQRPGNDSCRCRITGSMTRILSSQRAVACVAQLCDARAERARALKPFVACRDLIIVIPLYARERIRVITIHDGAANRDAGAVLG
jgi:hypothetical protein